VQRINLAPDHHYPVFARAAILASGVKILNRQKVVAATSSEARSISFPMLASERGERAIKSSSARSRASCASRGAQSLELLLESGALSIEPPGPCKEFRERSVKPGTIG
jgi:hypothetical protein